MLQHGRHLKRNIRLAGMKTSDKSESLSIYIGIWEGFWYGWNEKIFTEDSGNDPGDGSCLSCIGSFAPFPFPALVKQQLVIKTGGEDTAFLPTVEVEVDYPGCVG